ncbi:hypothetical protein BU17DRAFT_70868 [Hysterangium stoloniferum]|nr:hypothetical protein BU17DRAFT_70868 [Hysterangium stoloniferum]
MTAEQDNIVPPQSQHLLIVDNEVEAFSFKQRVSSKPANSVSKCFQLIAMAADIREKPRDGEKGSRKGKGSLLPQLPKNVDHTFSRSPLPLNGIITPKQDLAPCPQMPKKSAPSTFEALFTPPPRMPLQPIQPAVMSLDIQARSVTSKATQGNELKVEEAEFDWELTSRTMSDATTIFFGYHPC